MLGPIVSDIVIIKRQMGERLCEEIQIYMSS
jgi:hypothetical protein